MAARCGIRYTTGTRFTYVCVRAFPLEPSKFVRSIAIDKLGRSLSALVILALLSWELMVPCPTCLALTWLPESADAEREQPGPRCCCGVEDGATQTDDRAASRGDTDHGSPLSTCPGCSGDESNTPCCPLKPVYEFGPTLAFAIDMSDGWFSFEQPPRRPSSLTLDPHYPPPRT